MNTMFAQTASEKKIAQRFRAGLRRHLSTCGPQNKAVRAEPAPEKGKLTLGQLVSIPERDIIHVFASDAMLAISHAIEDLAGEVRSGELISTFQYFKNFAPQKKRYVALARDLDAVRVWGAGEPPKGCPGVDFIVAEDPKIIKYWVVLFDAPQSHAVLVCKQVNRTTEYAKKKFVGFYSFNPYLVQSIRWRFNMLSSGLSKIATHFDKSMAFPDFKMRDLDALFSAPEIKAPPRLVAVRGGTKKPKTKPL
jgi:hypothetical protein